MMHLTSRAKVKTVTFLLPVDDIYTNRPVLTKHQEDQRTGELASITETDSWETPLTLNEMATKNKQKQKVDATRAFCSTQHLVKSHHHLGQCGFGLSRERARRRIFISHLTTQTQTLVTGVAFIWSWRSRPPVSGDEARGDGLRGSDVRPSSPSPGGISERGAHLQVTALSTTFVALEQHRHHHLFNRGFFFAVQTWTAQWEVTCVSEHATPACLQALFV